MTDNSTNITSDHERNPLLPGQTIYGIWKDNKAIVISGVYLYLSLIGLTYDLVYYKLGYGVSIIHYVVWEDLAFSILKNMYLTFGCILTIVVLAWLIFGLINLINSEFARRTKEKAKQKIEGIKSFSNKRIQILSNSLQAYIHSHKNLNDLTRYIIGGVQESVRTNIKNFLKRVQLICKWLVCEFISISRKLIYKVSKLIYKVSIIFIFIFPFMIAFLFADIETRKPREQKDIVCVKWPKECIENVSHIGSMGRVEIFVTADNKINNSEQPWSLFGQIKEVLKRQFKGDSNLLMSVFSVSSTSGLKENTLIIPKDNMSSFHSKTQGSKISSGSPDVSELIMNQGAELKNAIQDTHHETRHVINVNTKSAISDQNNPAKSLHTALQTAHLETRDAVYDTGKLLISSLQSAHGETRGTINSNTKIIVNDLNDLSSPLHSALQSAHQDTRDTITSNTKIIVSDLNNINSSLHSALQSAYLDTQNIVENTKDSVMSSLQSTHQGTRDVIKSSVENIVNDSTDLLQIAISQTRDDVIHNRKQIEYEFRDFPLAKLLYHVGYPKGDGLEVEWKLNSNDVVKENISQFHKEISDCGDDSQDQSKRPRIVVQGFASPEPFKPLDKSNKMNCMLANKRMLEVARYLWEEDYHHSDDFDKETEITLDGQCDKPDEQQRKPIELRLKKYDAILLPWSTYDDLSRAMVSEKGGEPQNLVNRGFRFVIERLGKCEIALGELNSNG